MFAKWQTVQTSLLEEEIKGNTLADQVNEKEKTAHTTMPNNEWNNARRLEVEGTVRW